MGKTIEELLKEALVPVEEQPYEVPENWVWSKLGNIVDIKTGRKDANYGTDDGKYPFFTCAAEPIKSPDFSFDNEVVLLPGNGANVGLVLYYKGKFEAYQRTYILSSFTGYMKYLYYNLLWDWKTYNENKQFGSATNYIKLANITEYLMPLPPLSEQQRIVTKIESLFTKIDKAIELIEEAREGLENRKAAILAKAFRGQLTEKWREENIEIESAKVLLDKIKKKRILNYENECIKAKELKQRVPRKPRFMSDKEYDVNSNDIPNSWIECYIYEFADISIGGTPSRSNEGYWGGEIPWLSSGEVANNIIFGSEENITKEGLQNSNAKIYPKGTVLIAMIGEGKTRGQSSILGIEASTNQNVAGVIFDETLIIPKYVWYNFIYNYNKNRSAGRGGNQPALNSQKVGELTISLPPVEEQKEIVRILDTLLSIESKIEELTELEEEIEMLKRSILAKAFRGELGTNDPAEESAIELLKEVLKEKTNK